MYIKFPRIYYVYHEDQYREDPLDPYVARIANEGRHEYHRMSMGGPEAMHINSVKEGILAKLQACLGTFDTEFLRLYRNKDSSIWVLYESSETDYDSWYAIIGTKTFVETAFFILNSFERTDEE